MSNSINFSVQYINSGFFYFYLASFRLQEWRRQSGDTYQVIGSDRAIGNWLLGGKAKVNPGQKERQSRPPSPHLISTRPKIRYDLDVTLPHHRPDKTIPESPRPYLESKQPRPYNLQHCIAPLQSHRCR